LERDRLLARSGLGITFKIRLDFICEQSGSVYTLAMSAPAPPAQGHCGVVVVTADAVATRGKIMAKLTDTQLIILSNAAARDDGIAVVPLKMNKSAASKVGASLTARKLMRELRSKPGMPVWRQDENGRSISLMITRAGRDAIGVDEGKKEATQASRSDTKSGSRSPPHRKGDDSKSSAWNPRPPNAILPRAGSKQALVTEMLSANGGATIDALVKAAGWLPQTTRAALTGLRKRGLSIQRSREVGEASMYRIASPAASNQA
jgi:Protein of unknown function (DUF3489)